MKCKIVGVKKIDYNRKSDGARITGVELHYVYESKNIEGVGCDRAFISEYNLENNLAGLVPEVGTEVEFVYNRFGKIAGFNFA